MTLEHGGGMGVIMRGSRADEVHFFRLNYGEFRKRRNKVWAKGKFWKKIFVKKFADGVLRIIFPMFH